VAALERGGCNLIELGVPFSDPIADGPVIQRAADRALRAGTTLRGVLDIAARVRESSEIPLLLFTYLNPLLRHGMAALARDAARAGIDGCLLTDLSVEEAGPYVEPLRAQGLDTVFLAAPTSTTRRLELVAKYSTGFVYLVSRTGVTGEQTAISASIAPLVAAMRAITPLPLAVGFGISQPEHVRAVAGLADAVVVGSALVRTIERNPADPAAALEAFTRQLSSALPSKEK
jgi:tryptophan synthase alpha chain